MGSSLILYAIAVAAAAPAAAQGLPVYRYEVRQSYPHDPSAFTQGLFFHDGHLYESTGLEGHSTLRKVRLEDGRVLKQVALPPALFGEGIVNWRNEILGVTWKHGRGFRWDLATFRKKGEFRYSGEGWGLAQDGANIILSDGTPTLRFLDPKTMAVRRSLQVTYEGRPLPNMNELEWVKGEILANIWQTELIARINPATGQVKGWIDLSGLTRLAGARGPDSVLNGIAYDAQGDRLFVTGKNWPRLFEIRLLAPAPQQPSTGR